MPKEFELSTVRPDQDMSQYQFELSTVRPNQDLKIQVDTRQPVISFETTSETRRSKAATRLLPEEDRCYKSTHDRVHKNNKTDDVHSMGAETSEVAMLKFFCLFCFISRSSSQNE